MTHEYELGWGECWWEGGCRTEKNKGGKIGTIVIA